MARRIDYSARFPHPPERVYEALADPAHWEARMTEMRKYSENHVRGFTVSESGIALVLHHVLPRSDLPEIARTVIKKDMVITRKENYGPFTDGATGTYQASIPGGPGSLTGTMELFGDDHGATLRTTSEAKVHIPFVGGKLEELILTNLVDVFRTESAITADWLAGR
ncbi:Protein of unknown function [Rhodococcus pyridinivorans]|uniref:DUF2505 domain-containing protein n=1 Tax=Rhodococcus pyridinivorans TaxID=103816 RepID=UPI0007CD52CD|nr:DUF2505 domain-containing protein [Rhodococcus pyridinivorans]SEC41334.1 Protein of unknown function [Rhodococcus pyridinivorans]